MPKLPISEPEITENEKTGEPMLNLPGGIYGKRKKFGLDRVKAIVDCFEVAQAFVDSNGRSLE